MTPAQLCEADNRHEADRQLWMLKEAIGQLRVNIDVLTQSDALVVAAIAKEAQREIMSRLSLRMEGK